MPDKRTVFEFGHNAHPSIAWTCDGCHLSGIVLYTMVESINSLRAAVLLDHDDKSPDCPTAASKVRVVSEQNQVV